MSWFRTTAASSTPTIQPVNPATNARIRPRRTPRMRPLAQPTMMANGTP